MDEKILDILERYDSKEYLDFLLSVKNNEEDYYEKHHILPKSLFPEYSKDKNNLINLSPYNHLKAHLLLTKVFPSDEMNIAYYFMTNRLKNYSELEYNLIREQATQAIKNKTLGVKKTLQHRQNISKSKLGDKNPSFGKHLSKEHRDKISEKLKGKPPSELNRKICSERCKKRIGENNTQSKKVKCIEDDLVFNTVKECQEYYKTSNLYRYCSTGKPNTRINKHFEYVED